MYHTKIQLHNKFCGKMWTFEGILAIKTKNYALNFAQGKKYFGFYAIGDMCHVQTSFMLNVIQNQTHLGVVMREKLEILHHFLP